MIIVHNINLQFAKWDFFRELGPGYQWRCLLKSGHQDMLWMWKILIPQWTNGRHFADDIFKCIFLNENVWISLKISLKFVPRVQIKKYTSIGSDNGLVPTRWQAIIRTYDNPVHWCIYVALGGDELNVINPEPTESRSDNHQCLRDHCVE